MKIAVFGLGKLGAVLAAVHAAAGHEVVGVDIDDVLVESINGGQAPFAEPGLQDLIADAGSLLTATLDVGEAMQGADVSLIIVPTPSLPDGSFTNEYLVKALAGLGSCLTDRESRHTVIVCSTVMPGSCQDDLQAALESASGRAVGRDIGLVYSPEFIALGSIVNDMQNPDLVLIGESDTAAGDVAEQLARTIVQSEPAIHRMSLPSAELVKLAVNTFVTTKISFANMLSECCATLPDADIDVITRAVGSDSRIGGKYLKGALGYGGPCFPRDNLALTRFAEMSGVEASIAIATDLVNERQPDRIVSRIQGQTPPGGTVAVLGLAYKPNTPVCERSQAVDIANKLQHLGFTVMAHDPQATRDTAERLDPGVGLAEAEDEALSKADTVLIATPWPCYADLDWAQARAQGKIVCDPWGLLGDST